MTFLLDANVLLDFQRAEVLPALVEAAARVDFAVAEKVLDEVTVPRRDDSGDVVGKKRQAAKILEGSRIRTVEILPGSPAATLMQALLAPLKTLTDKDQGEAASVAAAASDSGLVFVTGDKVAVLWALNELFNSGERVMRVPVFIRLLHEKRALEPEAVREVADRATSHGAIPTWWASWLAEVTRTAARKGC